MAETKKLKSLPSFGDVMSTSWAAYSDNQAEIWKIVAPYVVIASAQGLAIAVFNNEMIAGALGIVLFGITLWMSIVLTKFMYPAVMGGKVDADKAKADLGKVLWPYIGASIVVGIITMLGLVAFIIPGIILGLMYYGTTYSTILDGKAVGEAMKFSIKITSGRKWQLFGLLLVVGIVIFIIYLLIIATVSLVLGLFGSLANEQVAAGLITVGLAIIDGAMIPFSTGIGVMIYGHLKKTAK